MRLTPLVGHAALDSCAVQLQGMKYPIFAGAGCGRPTAGPSPASVSAACMHFQLKHESFQGTWSPTQRLAHRRPQPRQRQRRLHAVQL